MLKSCSRCSREAELSVNVVFSTLGRRPRLQNTRSSFFFAADACAIFWTVGISSQTISGNLLATRIRMWIAIGRRSRPEKTGHALQLIDLKSNISLENPTSPR